MRRTFAVLAFALALTSCKSFTWHGRGGEIDPDAAARGLKGVAQLTAEYETERFWRGVRRAADGRANALGRDLSNIVETIDRHLFNYSWTDPAVNYETSTRSWDHLVRLPAQVLPR